MTDSSCIFCKIINHQLPATIIQEDESTITIKDIHPRAPIHYLIIPKKHIADIQSIQSEDINLMGLLFLKAQSIAFSTPHAQAFNLVINNGAAAGQLIFHLHVHFLAGKNLVQELCEKN